MIGGLAAMALVEEWPFGGNAELTRASNLVREGAKATPAELGVEYRRQFIGPGHFEAPAWGSVYLDPDEIVFGNSNLALCRWMREIGIELHEEGGREPADHIGKMIALLGWLAGNKPELVEEYLAEHLMPWVPRYLDLFEESSNQQFYQGLAILTRATLSGIVDELDVTVVKKQLFH